MKLRIASLSLLTILCLVLSAPAFAQAIIYNNGLPNGTIGGEPINFGFAISDSFPVPPPFGQIEGIMFAEWVPAGATPISVDVGIGSTSFGGSYSTLFILPNPTVVCLASGGGGCGHGLYDVYISTLAFNLPIDVPPGTSWLTLQNAIDSSGGQDGWDINNGLSGAFCNAPVCPTLSPQDEIPSESFTILGTIGTIGTTPEPSSILLFGSGTLGIIGVLRRRLMG